MLKKWIKRVIIFFRNILAEDNLLSDYNRNYSKYSNGYIRYRKQ